VNRPDERTTTTTQRSVDTSRQPTCDGPATPQDRTRRSRGAPSTRPVRGEGCPSDRTRGDAGNEGKGKGRPDDPMDQASGHGGPDQVPGDARGGTDGSHGTDGEGSEHENAGNAGKEQGSAGNAARTDPGHPG
jgi:hypothetical protein